MNIYNRKVYGFVEEMTDKPIGQDTDLFHFGTPTDLSEYRSVSSITTLPGVYQMSHRLPKIYNPHAGLAQALLILSISFRLLDQRKFCKRYTNI